MGQWIRVWFSNPATELRVTAPRGSGLSTTQSCAARQQVSAFPPVFQSHLSTSPKGTAADTPLSPTLSTFSAGVFSSPPYDLTLELNGFKAQSQFSSCSRQLAEILPLGASSRKAQINHTSQVLNIHQGQCSLYFNDAAWVHAKLLSRVLLFATLRAAAHQAPLSTGFSRQEYWNG